MGPVLPTTWSAKGEARDRRSVASRTMHPGEGFQVLGHRGVVAGRDGAHGDEPVGLHPGPLDLVQRRGRVDAGQFLEGEEQGVEILHLPRDHPDLLHRLLGGDGAPVHGEQGAAGGPGPRHPQRVVVSQRGVEHPRRPVHQPAGPGAHHRDAALVLPGAGAGHLAPPR